MNDRRAPRTQEELLTAWSERRSGTDRPANVALEMRRFAEETPPFDPKTPLDDDGRPFDRRGHALDVQRRLLELGAVDARALEDDTLLAYRELASHDLQGDEIEEDPARAIVADWEYVRQQRQYSQDAIGRVYLTASLLDLERNEPERDEPLAPAVFRARIEPIVAEVFAALTDPANEALEPDERTVFELLGRRGLPTAASHGGLYEGNLELWPSFPGIVCASPPAEDPSPFVLRWRAARGDEMMVLDRFEEKVREFAKGEPWNAARKDFEAHVEDIRERILERGEVSRSSLHEDAMEQGFVELRRHVAEYVRCVEPGLFSEAIQTGSYGRQVVVPAWKLVERELPALRDEYKRVYVTCLFVLGVGQLEGGKNHFDDHEHQLRSTFLHAEQLVDIWTESLADKKSQDERIAGAFRATEARREAALKRIRGGDDD